MATLVGSLLPAPVVAVEVRGDVPGAGLHPSESAAVSGAVPSRRAEFATGRHCARAALGLLGHPPVALERGPGGGPRWPEAVVGSITHCAGYRAAAVAPAVQVAALGIDAEPHEGLPPGVLRTVAGPAEAGRVAELTRAEPGVAWDRVLFSAKEAVYKAWCTFEPRPLRFRDVDLVLDPGGTFTGRLLAVGGCSAGGTDPACPPGPLHGRWAVREHLVLTAVVVPTPSVVAAALPGDAVTLTDRGC